MAETTGIEWANASWNPWMGCKMVSPGCAKCYMFRDMKMYGKDPNVVSRSKTKFDAPLKWARRWDKGVRDEKSVPPGSRIFTCSWSDWFIDKADEWRAEAWDIIKQTPQYTYMILTKRPERIAEHLPADWGDGYPNVWLGVTTENQKTANERIPILLTTPAHIRFLSVEPMLGSVDITGRSIESVWIDPEYANQDPELGNLVSAQGWGIDWVITGGESDSHPRPINLDWVRTIRDVIIKSNESGWPVALFHKQHGGNHKIDGAWGGRVLDGRTWDEFPESVSA